MFHINARASARLASATLVISILLQSVAPTAQASLVHGSHPTEKLSEKARWIERLDNAIDIKKQGRRLKSGENTHTLFNDQVEAIAWTKKLLPMLQNAFDDPNMKVLEETDPKATANYDLLKAGVKELWSAYITLFPDETRSLNEPKVVIIDAEEQNAFVPGDIETGRIAHVMVVFSGFLKQYSSEKDTLTGLIGHELAHSVFKHHLRSYAEKVTHFYDQTKYTLGYKTPKDASLDRKMNLWMMGARLTGEFDQIEFLNLPTPSASNGGTNILLSLLTQIVSDFYDKSDACGNSILSLLEWKALFRASRYQGGYALTTADKTIHQGRSQKFIDKLTQCVHGRKKSFIDLLSAMTGIPAKDLNEDADLAKTAKEFDAEPNIVKAVQMLVEDTRREMRIVESDVDVTKLGYFTQEEHADDISVLVHAHLNKNTSGLSKFFMDIMKSNDLADVTACQSDLTGNRLPPNGSFLNTHRGDCFRVSHMQRYADYLTAVKATDSDLKGAALEYSISTQALSLSTPMIHLAPDAHNPLNRY